MNDRCANCQVSQGRDCECREPVSRGEATLLIVGIVVSICVVCSLVWTVASYGHQIVVAMGK